MKKMELRIILSGKNGRRVLQVNDELLTSENSQSSIGSRFRQLIAELVNLPEEDLSIYHNGRFIYKNVTKIDLCSEEPVEVTHYPPVKDEKPIESRIDRSSYRKFVIDDLSLEKWYAKMDSDIYDL